MKVTDAEIAAARVSLSVPPDWTNSNVANVIEALYRESALREADLLQIEEHEGPQRIGCGRLIVAFDDLDVEDDVGHEVGDVHD